MKTHGIRASGRSWWVCPVFGTLAPGGQGDQRAVGVPGRRSLQLEGSRSSERPRPLHGEGLKVPAAGTGWRAQHGQGRGGKVTGVCDKAREGVRSRAPGSRPFPGVPQGDAERGLWIGPGQSEKHGGGEWGSDCTLMGTSPDLRPSQSSGPYAKVQTKAHGWREGARKGSRKDSGTRGTPWT